MFYQKRIKRIIACMKSKPAKCDHDKCYSNGARLSFPAQYPWICRKCGAQGTERDRFVNEEEYSEVVKKWEEEK